MTSRADKLLVVNNSGSMNLLVKILTIISFAALIIFMIGSISHKMIGVETLHSFQLIFLLQALTNNYTPTFGLLKCLSIVSGNFLFISNDKINIYNSKYGTLFNQDNQNFSEELIIGLSTLFLIFCLLPLLWKWKKILTNPETNQRKFSKIDAFVKVVYTHLVFPTVIGFLMITFLVTSTIVDNQLVTIFPALSP